MSPDADMELIGEYDEIEIPPVKPYVVRHRRFACRCAHCGAGVKAPAPAVATQTPFGPVSYTHLTLAFSKARRERLMAIQDS